MLKEGHPEYGCQRISDLLARGPGLAACASTVERECDKRVLSECLSLEGLLLPPSIYDTDISVFCRDTGFEKKYLHAIKELPDATMSKYLGFYLARFYYRYQRQKEASEVLREVVKATPFALSDDALLLLAQCLKETGEKDDARKAAQKGIDDFPDGNCARRARAMMER